jgi:hypothetical protein
MNGAQSHTQFGREDCIMAMALTKDERLVLRNLASGRSIEEIAATLNWPLQAVRWTCTHPLIAWVLDELEASTTQADPGAGREVSQWARNRRLRMGPRQTMNSPRGAVSRWIRPSTYAEATD